MKTVVTTQAEVDWIAMQIRGLHKGRELAIDTETTGLDLYVGDTIRGISLAFEWGSEGLQNYYVPLTHPDSFEADPTPLVRALNDTEAQHIFHNASFDWKALSQIGVRPRFDRYDDTSTLSWLRNENADHGLKENDQLWLGGDAFAEKRGLKAIMDGQRWQDIYATVKPGIRKGKLTLAKGWAKEYAAATTKTWGTLTADDIGTYALRDTEATLALYNKFLLDMNYHGTPPWTAYPRELKWRGLTYRVTETGVRVDLERVAALEATYVTQLAAIEVDFEGINLASTKQLAELLYDTWELPCTRFTETGGRSTDKEALADLEGSHEGIEVILEHRRLSKMVGTYLRPMGTWSDEEGRVHTQLNPIGTVTGRLSSSHPNMQNIPKQATDDTVKSLFIPAPGFELWEYDLHSAELYVGASIANDTDMMAALSEEGRDFHDETADKVFGRHDEPYRTFAKNLNYGVPYGIGARKFATYLAKAKRRAVSERDVRMAQAIIQRHREAWPLTHRAIKTTEVFARENRFLPLHVEGRYRHFWGAGYKVPADYTAWNAAVQGGVAEFMKDHGMAIEPELPNFGARIVLQVHDSWWVEQPPGMGDHVTALMQLVSDDINPFRMRLTWDAKQLGAKHE